MSGLRERRPMAYLHNPVPFARPSDRGKEFAPFIRGVVAYPVSFVGLATSLYPCPVAPVTSLAESAACGAAPVFLLSGIGMLTAVLHVYNGFRYPVLRGMLPHVYPERGATPQNAGKVDEHSGQATVAAARRPPGGTRGRLTRV